MSKFSKIVFILNTLELFLSFLGKFYEATTIIRCNDKPFLQLKRYEIS